MIQKYCMILLLNIQCRILVLIFNKWNICLLVLYFSTNKFGRQDRCEFMQFYMLMATTEEIDVMQIFIQRIKYHNKYYRYV